MNTHDLTRRIEALEREKFNLPYDYDKAHGNRHDWKAAEKATAPRRREILDELKLLRAERKALIEAARAERTRRAEENRAKRQSARESVTAECQICEGRQCVRWSNATHTEKVMVHHGYQRPGIGFIVGDCFGVDRKPYPATDALAEYLVSVTQGAQGVADALSRINEQTVIVKMTKEWNGPVTNTYRKECDAVTWSRELRSLKCRLESELRWLKSEVERVTARIARATGAKP